MAEVIGAISAVITIIETSIKTYDSTQKDIKLSETFEVVRRRLPIIRDTLETCKSHIEAKADSVPENVCDALEKTLEDCDTKATNIRAIFEKIIPGQSDKWMERYLKILRRLGKGNKVEELMIGLTEDVQLIVNHDAVRSSNQPQHDELEAIIEEIKSVTSSVPDEESSTMNFSSGGGAQTNNVNKGSGPWNINSGSGKQYNAGTQNFVTKQKEDFTFRGPVGLCLRQAPNISPDLFVGRGSELDEITEYLHKFQHQACLVLGGMGGIGKSRLAVAYAESRSKSYTSVFWLNATSEASLKASFRLIAGLIFEVQDPEVLDGEEIIGRVHHWLSDPKNTRWLLIFDNYDDSDQFKISEYYPLTSWGAIIVTTRRPDLVPGNTHTLDVKAFQNIKDSLRVLQTRSKRQNVQSDPYAKRLAERLAGLPLALATAGTYLQRNTVSFERYLQEYERLWNIDPHRPAKLHEYSERTLYTTWDLSYARLEAEDSYAAQLLKLLAYFGNQSLWYELFYDGLTDQSPHWLRGLVAYMSFQGAMGKLTEYYFLEVHVESGTWSMHNCVHDWTLAVLNKNVDIEYYWYAFDCVDATINKVDTDSFGYVTFARSASHAIQLGHQRFLENNMTYCPAAERVVKVSRVSQLLRDQIQLLAAEKMYMRALAGYEKALGPDHISTLNTVNNLGLLYGDQGKLDDAEEMYTRALAGKEKALGPDHTSTLATVNNLGSLYHD
ncbi:hypothetical protein PENSOL_c015G00659 [Penicillium solitum]|uniref:Uncharacterized protein n=1 Tax=Penicillium solitum TaxID=60172 RepID=A0A1V6R5R5_9EURO|nr:uncharacterized protein PENSOL_c015G00659 [Penicillium solitum]OQD96542.1 hypothetical protein PENSOL_c015G00659 [Penicillium solitum]